MNRYLLIDPYAPDVKDILTPDDFDYLFIRDAIKCEHIEHVRLAEKVSLWVDEEFLLKNDPMMRFWTFGTYPHPLGGYGMICGLTQDGDSVGLPDNFSGEEVGNNVSIIGDAIDLELKIRNEGINRPSTVIESGGKRETISEWRNGTWMNPDGGKQPR